MKLYQLQKEQRQRPDSSERSGGVMRSFLTTTAMVTSAALLSACATASTKDDPAKKALELWGDCVMKAISQMDDGKTDPLSLAYGISPRCGVQYNDYTQIMINENWTEGGQNAARQLAKDDELKLDRKSTRLNPVTVPSRMPSS